MNKCGGLLIWRREEEIVGLDEKPEYSRLESPTVTNYSVQWIRLHIIIDI